MLGVKGTPSLGFGTEEVEEGSAKIVDPIPYLHMGEDKDYSLDLGLDIAWVDIQELAGVVADMDIGSFHTGCKMKEEEVAAAARKRLAIHMDLELLLVLFLTVASYNQR
jgi:hypothetical protein